MRRSPASILVLFALACGPSQAPSHAADPPEEVTPAVPSAPDAAPSTEAPSAPELVPVPGSQACEARIANCGGGWIGCVHVARDPETHFLIGVGASAGTEYVVRDAISYEVCTGGSPSVCRPPVMAGYEMGVSCVRVEDAPPVPRQAPFTCSLVDGACVQGPDPTPT